jgi:hypothetical protein
MVDTAPRSAKAKSHYDRDFYAWTQEQSRLLRERARPDGNDGLDYENLAEEIESLGREIKREISSRITVLLELLLRWRHQPELRERAWLSTILHQRQSVADLLDECPSLVAFAREAVMENYADAVADADLSAGPLGFPDTPPFTIDQVFDMEFLPQDLDGPPTNYAQRRAHGPP